jgi:hypothetical protein
MPRNCCLFLLLFSSNFLLGQQFKISGKITDRKLEPLAFASVQVKGQLSGVISNEEGNFELILDAGSYEVVFSLIGYKSQIMRIAVTAPYVQNVILDEDKDKLLGEVVVKGKDRSEEIIRKVINNREAIAKAAGSYSAKVYIRATQQDSVRRSKRNSKLRKDSLLNGGNTDLLGMAMAEIYLALDYESEGKIKEERRGVVKRGNPESLFYLSTTNGNFSLYNNLLKAPAISVVPFLSPISLSGLLAYKYRIVKVSRVGGQKIYNITVNPRQFSNTTVQGELKVLDSAWVVIEARFTLPVYHLPEYDYFEVWQQYGFIGNQAWMLNRQEFNYYSKTGKGRLSGKTVANYADFELNKTFPKKHFGVELSAAAEDAYEKDSSFWQTVRAEPLTEKELRFIRYKDSVYRATNTKQYLDSLDRVINKVTIKKIGLFGQTFNDWQKKRTWSISPLSSMYQPLVFGGARIYSFISYNKTFKSRKNISLLINPSYGIRNRDLNGTIGVTRMYNPFNSGFYRLTAGRDFQYIFQGDAWINQVKRSNIYLNTLVGAGHGLELVNGLFFYSDMELALRKSVSGYKTNDRIDSLFGDLITNNRAVSFTPYNAFYGKLRLQYTPAQRYIREPKEKIILGSKWPNFYLIWRRGIPGLLQSKVDFDYLEFGIEQELKLGIVGVSKYNIKTGNFLSRKDLRLVDYQFQRRGDPFLFMNPHEAFQSLDSTFAVFRQFYQAHYVHEFNGALLNKIPLFKKLRLRELAGGGFLVAPERKLRYVEAFAGVERIFKWPFNPLTRFKLGVYVVGSAANQFGNPVQFKIGLTTWDKLKNKWL